MKLCHFLVLLFTHFAFAQSSNVLLEEKIYTAIDNFAANPTKENLLKLEASEKLFKVKSSSEWLAIVILNCNKGYYENRLGLTNNAILSYEKAWLLFTKHQLKNLDIIEDCLKPLGNLYTIIGDYDSAENTIKQYYFISNNDKKFKYHKIGAIVNLSNVYNSSGKNELAINLLETTIKTDKIDANQKAVLLNNLGSNYINVGNFEKAKQTLYSAINILKNNSEQLQMLSNSYRNLASIYSEEQNFHEANMYFQKAKKIVLETKIIEPRKLAKLYFEEATLLYKQNKNAQASRVLQTVFKIVIPNHEGQNNKLPEKKWLYTDTVLLDALDLQALLFLDLNDPKKAIQSYQLSFYIETMFQSLIVQENAKIINLIRNRNRTEKCIEIYVRLYKEEKNREYISTAFLLSEQSKSLVLKEYYVKANSISKEEKNILAEIQNCANNIVLEQQKQQNASINSINKSIQKQNELILFLKKTRENKSINTTENLDLDKLKRKLENQKATLVSYFYGTNTVYSFIVNKEKVLLKTIGNSTQLSRKTAAFLDFFKTANAIENQPLEYNNCANILYKTLKFPELKLTKNLIILPDGILNFVPFEALITNKSSTTNFSKMNYLLYDYTISYLNSVHFYLNSYNTTHSKKEVLGIFPIFKNSLYELAFSVDELKNIKNQFAGTYFEEKEATFLNFKKNASKFAILHLSTHANSGDIVTPATISFYDHDVLYSELYNLDLKPDLVVLSACETGIGKLYKAEGSMSVARGFQVSGAQNLLFSLWKVNDFTTSVLMKNFYKNFYNGLSFQEANHHSKVQFLSDKTISNTKKSPYYWASFVYYGSIEKNNENKLWLLALGLFSLLGIIFLCLKKRKKVKSS